MGARLGRIAVAVALMFTACGSTVPGAQRHVASATGELGESTATTAPKGSVASADVTAGPSAETNASQTTRTTTRASAAAAVSHAPVEVGVGVDRNNDAFAAAFGASTSQPDEKDVASAIVADINHHGGLAGHPIAPVYAAFDSTSTDWIAQDQAMCAQFINDHHVVAAVRTDDIFGPLDSCLATARTPLVLYESYFRPPSWFTAYPGLRFVPDNPDPARLYRALVDRMVATKRWTPSSKIGLVRYDRADQAEVETKAVRTALAAHGLKLADARGVHTPESFQDIGATSSQLEVVILRFRQAGIDNVVFEGGDISYLFATAAQAQGYKPKYAITSFDFPNGMPPAQLPGAFGVGWEPSDDLPSALPTSPGVKRCQDATRGLHADYGAAGTDRIYLTCDSLYFLKAAYDAAGDVGPGALARGARQLGAGLASAFTFAIDTDARADGAAAYRDLFFDGGCACLKYGEQHQLP